MARQERGLRLLDKIENKDIEGVKQILNYDVDITVDRKGDTPIHLAARKGYLDILQILVENGGDVNQKNQNGFAALHYAAREGKMDIVHFLLKCGAQPNIKNADGDGPIHELVKFQPMDIIEEMVTLGMNVNLKNKMGRTPLHVAAANNRQEAMETLLTCGARSDLKDKYGRTAADICKNSQIVEMMKLHSLTMEAMKKGIVQAQGISVTRQKAKNRIHLQRVGVVIETIAMPTDVTASFYLRREKSENSSYSFYTEKGDEMLSDVFFIKISDVPRICDVTVTLPIYGIPTSQEELFVRFDTGSKLSVTNTQSTEEGKCCTFATKLTPDCFSVCALFTSAKTDVKQVGYEGGVITTDADKEMKIEIPPATFNEEANISIQVFPTESNVEQSRDTVLTDVYNINADNLTTNNKMTLTLPLHETIDNGENIVLVTAEEITDDTDENSLFVVDTEPRVRNNTLVYDIPHFSIHVAVDKRQFETNKKDIYDRLVRATERQRSAVFFVAVRNDVGTSPIIVVECSLAEKSSKRIKKWITKDYKSQSPEQSGIYLLNPYQEFSVSFQGVLPEESDDRRKLAFLPRRASFQPYRIAIDSSVQSLKEGSVVIQKTSKDQVKKGTSETIAVLPFSVRMEEEKASVSDEEAESEQDQTELTGVKSDRPECEEDQVEHDGTVENNDNLLEHYEDSKQKDEDHASIGNPEEPNAELQKRQKSWLMPSYLED